MALVEPYISPTARRQNGDNKPAELETNCGKFYYNDSAKKSNGFIAGLGICCFFAILGILLFIQNHFYPLEFSEDEEEIIRSLTHDHKKCIIIGIIVIVLLGGIGGLAYGYVISKEEENNKHSEFPIKPDEKDVCKQFQEYTFSDADFTTSENITSITLPENKVLRKITIIGTKRQTIDLVVKRKTDNAKIVIPLDVYELKNGWMQCVHDALFTSDLFSFELNLGEPCKITYGYSNILPEHVDYINNHRVITRICQNKLLYIAEDHKSFHIATVYCEI